MSREPQDHIRTFAHSYDVTTKLGRGTNTAFVKLYTNYTGYRDLEIVCQKGEESYVIASIVYQQCELWKNRRIGLKELDTLCSACDVRNLTTTSQ